MAQKSIKQVVKVVGFIVIAGIIFGAGMYANIIKLPIKDEIHLSYFEKLSDDRALVGGSHNVFVGKVIKQIGNKGKMPHTQFTVDIALNVKGNLQGTIIVNQIGGYKNGILHLAEEDSLLEPGSSYLFAVRYDQKEDWYTISAPPIAVHLRPFELSGALMSYHKTQE